jgi:hypothetical protein
MENLRKKNETETQNTVEVHFSRLEQVENRISELKNKKNSFLKEKLKTISQTTQELRNEYARTH